MVLNFSSQGDPKGYQEACAVYIYLLMKKYKNVWSFLIYKGSFKIFEAQVSEDCPVSSAFSLSEF